MLAGGVFVVEMGSGMATLPVGNPALPNRQICPFGISQAEAGRLLNVSASSAKSARFHLYSEQSKADALPLTPTNGFDGHRNASKVVPKLRLDGCRGTPVAINSTGRPFASILNCSPTTNSPSIRSTTRIIIIGGGSLARVVAASSFSIRRR
jgi:hypothetical protein